MYYITEFTILYGVWGQKSDSHLDKQNRNYNYKRNINFSNK